jgi:hypothetical protein
MKNYLLLLFTLAKFSTLAQPNFVWAKQIAGSGGNRIATCMSKDDDGNLYIAGYFSGYGDFDPSFSVYTLTSINGEDAFICKLDSNGNFVYAKQFGGTSKQQFNSLLIKNGMIYVTGTSCGTADFDPNGPVYNLTSKGAAVITCKLDLNGNLQWAKMFDGDTYGSLPNNNVAYNGGVSVVTDSNSDVYIAGFFADTVDFDPSPNIYNLISSNYGGAFLTKLNSAGNFVWAKTLGSSFPNAMLIDLNDKLHIAGSFTNVIDVDPGNGTHLLSPIGLRDLFLLELDNAGDYLDVMQCGGTNAGVYASSIISDQFNNIYLSGSFSDTINLNSGAGSFQLTSGVDPSGNGNSGMTMNAFFCKIDEMKNILFARSFFGSGSMGSGSSSINSLSLDENFNIYVTGHYENQVDFDPGPAVHNLFGGEIFVGEYDANGNMVCVGAMGGGGGYYGEGGMEIIVSNSFLYSTGVFNSTNSDFDPGTGTFFLNGNSNQDIYVSKLKVCHLVADIHEKGGKNSISIYPIPSSGLIWVELKNAPKELKICVYDLLGNCLWNNSFTNKSNVNIDLSDQSRGIYFVEIVSDGKKSVNKIVLQ